MTDVEPRPGIPELEDDYRAEPYADPWNSILERISQADPEILKRLTNWGIGDV